MERVTVNHAEFISLSGLERLLLLVESLRQMSLLSNKRRTFEGYTPTESDVFVATYGKSGTNWMMQIAQQIAWRGQAEFEHVQHVIPWPDAAWPIPEPLADSIRSFMSPLDSGTPLNPSPTNLRVIKTHLEAGYCPYNSKATYLTVVRDPKEVVVSSYLYLAGVFGILDTIPLEVWLQEFLKPGLVITEWSRHTASYWNWRDFDNTLMISYGDLKKHPVENIKQVASRMGVDLKPYQLDKIAYRSSFEYMQEHESQFGTTGIFPEIETPMIRRGESGASSELLSEEQRLLIDTRAAEELARLGSSFPYEELFIKGDLCSL